MPELPEVETVVRTLRPTLEGRRIAEVWWSGLGLRLGRPLDLSSLREASAGAIVRRVHRRGKYVLLDLHRRGQSRTVIVHLGMSGRLRLQAGSEPRAPHTHVVWSLDRKEELRFVDPRRFGWVRALESIDEAPELRALGPDPLLELDEAMLREALAGSRAPIKAALLDQRRVAGLGNIYVCEALFRAGVHPCTPAGRAARRAPDLVKAIRAALELGVANRGTTLRDYVDASGASGGNQHALLVYGREGLPCSACGTLVRRRVDAGRSTFFCARCQRR